MATLSLFLSDTQLRFHSNFNQTLSIFIYYIHIQQTLIELCARDRWIVHKDLAASVDLYRQGIRPVVEERHFKRGLTKRGNHKGWRTTLVESQDSTANSISAIY